MQHFRIHTRTIATALALTTVVSVGAVISTTATGGSARRPDTVDVSEYRVLPGIAAWADLHHMSGGSPEALQPVRDLAALKALPAIAAWADAHGFGGLSPASMSTVATGG